MQFYLKNLNLLAPLPFVASYFVGFQEANWLLRSSNSLYYASFCTRHKYSAYLRNSNFLCHSLLNKQGTNFFSAFENPDKRKASTEHLEQPPAKKIATDGPVMASSSPSHMQGEAIAPAPSNDSNVGPSTSSEHMPNNDLDGKVERGKGDRRSIKTSAILNQVWKDDLKSGHILASLFELFGQDILSFIPAPEMSLFLWLILKIYCMQDAVQMESCLFRRRVQSPWNVYRGFYICRFFFLKKILKIMFI